jgi:PII-like signaling protein
MGLAGAAALRGPMSFGRSSRLRAAKVFRLSEDPPMVIEIIHTEARIKSFLPALDQMTPSGHLTLERVQILQSGPEVTHPPGPPASRARPSNECRKL